MINREIVKATVNTYGGIDEYGQELAEIQSTREIEVTIGIYTHTATSDIRYQDVSYFGLTKDKEVTDRDILVIGDKEYKVLFVNPTSRWTQLYLC